MVVDLGIDMGLLDEAFFDDLDEVMEETMIGIFVLHPKNETEIAKAQELCDEHPQLFYTLPFEQQDHKDGNCKAFVLTAPLSKEQLDSSELPLFLSSDLIDSTFSETLAQSSAKGVILNPSSNYGLENFYECLTENQLESFSAQEIEAINMEHIVLQSDYPHQDFHSIDAMAKKVSNAIFRPEESIKNHATRNSLALLGLR